MAQQTIFLGTNPNDGTGESLRGGGSMINANFTELYALQSATINAGAVEFAAASNEARIQLAINAAVLLGKSQVFIPAQYIPFDGTLVTFDASIRMVREGGNWNTYDARAYGVVGWGLGIGRAPPEYSTIADARIAGGIEIIAHRGGMDFAPENTMAAFSIAAGFAHSVEFDVQFSSDGVPVVLHDPTVDRTSDLTGNVKDLTIAALEAGDFGSWFNARFTGTRIPRFRDALKYCQQWARLMYPEIKGYRSQADIALFMAEIIDLGLESRCIVQSFNASDFQFARSISDEVRLGFTVPDIATFDELYPYAASDGNTIMLSDYNVILSNPTRIETARADGVDVGVWTVSSPSEYRQLVDLGVRRIMSNKLIRDVVSE